MNSSGKTRCRCKSVWCRFDAGRVLNSMLCSNETGLSPSPRIFGWLKSLQKVRSIWASETSRPLVRKTFSFRCPKPGRSSTSFLPFSPDAAGNRAALSFAPVPIAQSPQTVAKPLVAKPLRTQFWPKELTSAWRRTTSPFCLEHNKSLQHSRQNLLH